jgi:2-oxoglutarate/2-oxoacid ferredoxin oxidoreductase subunit beta
VDRPSYDALVQSQLETARAKSTGTPEEQLAGLLHAGDTWTIV